MKRAMQMENIIGSDRRIFLLATILAAMVVATSLLPGEAEARRGNSNEREPLRYVLNFGDAPFYGERGNPSVLFLKKELLRQYPGVDVSNLRLQHVILVAKTRIGRGVAQLRVGPELTQLYRVDGRPSAFHNHSNRSFDHVNINNPYRQSWGPWQLHLTGQFKVRKVVLLVEDRPRPPYGRKKVSHHRRFDDVYFGWRW